MNTFSIILNTTPSAYHRCQNSRQITDDISAAKIPPYKSCSSIIPRPCPQEMIIREIARVLRNIGDDTDKGKGNLLSSVIKHAFRKRIVMVVFEWLLRLKSQYDAIIVEISNSYLA
ncbi:unnamed protein product [Gordionus sp. m RMFG-2023]